MPADPEVTPARLRRGAAGPARGGRGGQSGGSLFCGSGRTHTKPFGVTDVIAALEIRCLTHPFRQADQFLRAFVTVPVLGFWSESECVTLFLSQR